MKQSTTYTRLRTHVLLPVAAACAAALLLGLPGGTASLQQHTPGSATPGGSVAGDTTRSDTTRDTAAAASGNAIPDSAVYDASLFEGLRFRTVGPSRGGRVTAVTGHRAHPRTFYMGSTGGGIWKTTDDGQTWRNVSDGELRIGAMGALEVADSDTSVVYAGTGSDGIRSNVITGRGMYKSTDAGETWAHIGLENAGQIGRIAVHPESPDTVYAAALGHPFRTNPERGVYKTTDGGQSWARVLHVSDSTGAYGLELHPTDPSIVYATMWRGERKPWTIISGARAEDGIYKSTDAGASWTKLEEGLPQGLIGKIDLSVSPDRPDRVYALVEAKEPDEGLYRSDDRGQSWTQVSDTTGLMERPFYYTNVTADPADADVVYVNNEDFYKSTDGGETFKVIDTPHGDNHDMWINPDDPKVMVQSNDGGANVSRDGGRTWSTQQNQPTAELYQVNVDDRFPYWLYAGQQDNSTISVPSRPPAESAPSGSESWWEAVGGCETGPAVPKPGNASIVYANCKGRFGRYSRATGQEKQYYVGAQYMYGRNPAELTYRFQRTVPIEVAPGDTAAAVPTIYHGSQYVHKTTDEGVTWETISPDLTANKPEYQMVSGGPITRDITGEEHYSALYTIEASPHDSSVIWTGANDGPVHVTRDGGETWQDVTPPTMPEDGRIDAIEPSPHQPGKAYIAMHRRLLGDSQPYIYKTENYGQSWRPLTPGGNGLPGDAPARVVREDPSRAGLLYAGTDLGVFVSFDDGAHWRPLQQGLPATPVTDIKVHEKDLVLSTMGRGFWILDDLTPLHQMTDRVAAAEAHLFAPRSTHRVRYRYRASSPADPQYPPPGAFISYYLSEAPEGPLTLEIMDEGGEVIRTFTSAAPPSSARSDSVASDSVASDSVASDSVAADSAAGGNAAAGRLVGEATMHKPSRAEYATDSLRATPGLHRFVWDLEHPGTWQPADERAASQAGPGEDGPMVAPGRYRVRLSAGDWSQTRPLQVKMDPRVAEDGVTRADLREQLQLSLKIRDAISQARRAAAAIDSVKRDVSAAIEAGEMKSEEAAEMRHELFDVERSLVTAADEEEAPGSYPPPMLIDQLEYLYYMTTAADQQLGQDAFARYEELRGQLDDLLGRWKKAEGQTAKATSGSSSNAFGGGSAWAWPRRADTSNAPAVPLTQEALENLRFRNIGPAVTGGRIHDLEALPQDPSTIYAATATGGIWKTTNKGTTWDPIFEDQPVSTFGDVAIAPSDSSVVWAGTGEQNNRQSTAWGNGVYRSTDAGQSWTHRGLDSTRHIGQVLVHPEDAEVAYVAALGNLWKESNARGVYKTTDGGQSWDKVFYADSLTGVVDMAMDPEDPETLYAAAYQRLRRAWGFNGGGPGSGLYKSTDGGETWEELTDGIPEGPKGRIGIGVARANPDRLYATIQHAEEGGTYRSDDGGDSWKKVNELNPRPMYYSHIEVDPNDASRVYVLGTEFYMSADAGSTFVQLPTRPTYDVGVHSDHHSLWIDPENPEHFYLAGDAGLHESWDRGQTYMRLNNFPIGQFYAIGVDMRTPYRVYGGMQDNHTWVGPSATRRYIGITEGDWKQIGFGDGMYQQPTKSKGGHRYVYSNSQNGGLTRVDATTGDIMDLRPYPPQPYGSGLGESDTSATGEEYRFDWVTPSLASAHDTATVYFGGNRLFISENRGQDWTRTKDLTKDIERDSLFLMGKQLGAAELLSENDGTASYSEATTIDESPRNADVLWVGTDDGNVQRSRDGGETWTNVRENIRGVPDTTYVSRVLASADSAAAAYVTFDAHRQGNFAPYVFKTTDYGETWTDLSGGLPTGSVNVIVEHPDNPDVLFLGTEHALFASTTAGEEWTAFASLPTTLYDDLKIHPREKDLVVGTHGRSIYILDDTTPLARWSAAAEEEGPSLFPIQPATLFHYWKNTSYRSQEAFAGENPAFGALMSYHLDAPADSVQLTIRNEEGEVVRRLSGPGSAGTIHRLSWNLTHAPPPYDEDEEDEEEEEAQVGDIAEPDTVLPALPRPPEPQGPFVSPGTYTATLEAGDRQDEVSFEVKGDPEMPITQAQHEEREDFLLDVLAMQREAWDATQRSTELDDALAARRDSLEEVEDLPQEIDVRADTASARAERLSALTGRIYGLASEFNRTGVTQATLYPPTQTQRRRHEALQERLQKEVGRLEELERAERRRRQQRQGALRERLHREVELLKALMRAQTRQRTQTQRSVP